ncbi:MAG TPA: hypothetical protein PKE64_07155 [Anaerolineae bacterium]|nr:hypothetical protein [Anaerolineae bacterium]HMR63775.1 hypothetical protein [Anaerolineae bacterium]
MTTQVCDRASQCLNFWLKERPECNECGVLINMNHFHNTSNNYRICHDCFERNLPAIAAGAYRPTTWIENEVRACLNYAKCFAAEPYGLFKPKVCDQCGKLYPPEHYHDIHRNIRICLACYQAAHS